MSSIVGVEKLYYAKLLTDTAGALTFDTPVYLPGVQKIGFKPKYNKAIQYGENKIWDQVNTFDSADVSVQRADLTSAERADLLGQTIAALGGVFNSSEDVAPYVATLYKANLANGGFRYGVFYKGKYGPPDEDYAGKEGKTDFQSPSIAATYQACIHTIDVGGDAKSLIEYHVDTTDANCPSDIDDTWFASVAVPTADTVAPTLTSVPANNATNVLATAAVVITFNKAMDLTTLTAGNIKLISAAGALIACTLTVNTLNTIVTLTPGSSLSAGTVYFAIVSEDVRSASGVNLAAASSIKFTVAS